MVADLITNWFGWPDGAVLTNLIASAIWVTPTLFMAIRHFKCRDCWRPGRVPVKGTHHHVCKTHAVGFGHTH